jgi:acetyl-CoA acetyltransferase
MENSQKTDGKQTVTGKFPPGNKIGKQFPKGTTGNPSGRPKLTRLTDALREQITEHLQGAPERTIAEAIARKLIKLALDGDIAAIREVFDRTEGKPKQAIDLDLQVSDWRTEAQKYGVTEEDVINEAKLLIAESTIDSSGE